jgi:hypothetical protein
LKLNDFIALIGHRQKAIGVAFARSRPSAGVAADARCRCAGASAPCRLNHSQKFRWGNAFRQSDQCFNKIVVHATNGREQWEILRMHTAPWWSRSAGHLLSRRAGVLALLLAATLVGACVPEHGEEDYAMSGVTRQRPIERARAAKLAALTDRALLTPARPPACGSRAAAEPREDGRAFHQLTSSDSKAALDAPADRERKATASAATPPANPAPARDQAASDLEMRIALEYERACYKQAEARVRARLNKLQASVSEAIKAAERRAEVQPAEVQP